MTKSELVNITSLPLMYDRGDKGYGVPCPDKLTFRGTTELNETLMQVRYDLMDMGWLPHIKAFLTAGTYVDKAGAHGEGKAIDFDGVLLEKNPLLEHKIYNGLLYKKGEWIGTDEYNMRPLTPRIKTRFAALLSLHFGVVLTSGYNEAHRDHIHCDLSRGVWWRGSKSQLILIYEICDAWNVVLPSVEDSDDWFQILNTVAFSPEELQT